MSKNEQLNTPDEPIVDEVLAKVIKLEDGYHVVDQDGTVGPVLTITKDGISFILSPNASNRKYFAVKRVEEAIEKCGQCDLTYKGSRTIGPVGSRSTTLPNAKLISYLSEEEQEEYKAIIARAMAARDADKKKPMTELEKAKARAEKAKAAYEALLAQAAEM
jgi:hypothetical protein